MQTTHDMRAILGEDFFKEEVRCDYLISAEMKRIWAVQMDMYLSFAEVCDKFGLKYFLDGGTLLGAIRHDGYIPWDDDLDVIMPREDYNKFMTLSSEFSDPIFLQTPYTDPGYYVSWIKLRNSSTTGLSKDLVKEPFNQGIWLDIFPLDYCIPALYEENRNCIYEHMMKCSSAMKTHSYNMLDERQKENYIRYQSDNPLKEWEAIQAIAANPEYRTSEDMSNVVTLVYGASHLMWKAEWYKDSVMHKFETFEAPIPIGWHARLENQFGDYMKFPPVEQRGVRHSNMLFDPDKSYLLYTNQK